MSKKWIEMSHEKRAHIFPTYWYWKSVQYVAKALDILPGKYACYYKNHEMSYIGIDGCFFDMASKILKELKENNELINKIEETNKTEIPKLLEFSQWFLDNDLSKVSGKELAERHGQVYGQFMKLMTYSAMGTVLEFENPLLSNYLEGILKNKVGDDQLKVGEYFNILSTPTRQTIPQKEEIELRSLKIALLQDKAGDKDVVEHTSKYSHIAYAYDGPGWSVKEVEERLKDLPDNIKELKKEIEYIKNVPERISARQINIIKKLALNEKEIHLFQTLSILGFWKFDRKLVNQKSHEIFEKLLEEIMRRFHLSKPQVKMLTPQETEDLLINEKMDINILNERIKLSIAVFEGYEYEKVFVAKEAQDIEKEILISLEVDADIKNISGTCAYPGQAQGIVKRVDDENEMAKFELGDILVSTSTAPKIVPIMKQAGAIITDSGGITCHAAIVSRELKVPCIIGTKIATRVLKDGDKVKVDAAKGLVEKL